jgi:hypothetical protein
MIACSSVPGYGQNADTDSLLHELKEAKLKINVLKQN